MTNHKRYTVWDLSTLAAQFLAPITELFRQPRPSQPAPTPPTPAPFAEVEFAPPWPHETPGVPYTAPHDRPEPETMSGPEVCRLMRRNHCTVAQLAERLGVTVYRVRMVRSEGIEGADLIAAWCDGITGKMAEVGL